jgi:hypothetical protein
MCTRGDYLISGATFARNFPGNVEEIHRKPQSVSQRAGRVSNQGLSTIEVLGLTTRPPCSVKSFLLIIGICYETTRRHNPQGCNLRDATLQTTHLMSLSYNLHANCTGLLI